MSHYLLDSDWVVDALYGMPQAVDTLTNLAPHGLALSLITYAELYQGAYYARNPMQALGGLRQFLLDKELLPVTSAVAERFAILRGSLTKPVLQQVGDMDLFIAATALAYNLVVVTRNLRDFQLIPSLSIYQAA